MNDDAAYVRAYARALFGAARRASAMAAVEADWRAVLGLIAQSSDLRRWMVRRVLSTPARRIAEMRQRLGAHVSPTTQRLLERMAMWDHVCLIPQVAQRYDEERRRAEGRVSARVTCAQEPRPATLDAIRSRLTPAGKTLDVDVRIEPRLLAGLTVRIEDCVIDASLAGRLSRMRRALAEPARLPTSPSAPA